MAGRCRSGDNLRAIRQRMRTRLDDQITNRLRYVSSIQIVPFVDLELEAAARDILHPNGRRL